ncbi:MAG: hypothetical protein QOK10_791 [Pseudonocardiales bacterium]|jgi:hypothetical protein|nr:hypothetical protein [Pseudonocardiales bacterium]
MTPADLLLDAFGRVREVVHATLDGLDQEQLATRPGPRANSIAWLVWHLTRIQDDHVARAAGWPQVYTAQDFASRFQLPFDDADTGYGHSPDDVAAVRPKSADLLIGYHDAVHDQTARYVVGLGPEELARIVDRSWNPPVTLGIRLISVISDDLQHAGQAAYVRGLLGA